MRHTSLIVGVAALTFAVSVTAKPGNGNGNGDGYELLQSVAPGVGGCVPGLAKHYGCLPPGHARKILRGQHFPNGFGSPYRYQEIPYDLRRRFSLNPHDHYYYNDGSIYQVDPRTMTVKQVIGALHH